MEIRLGSDLSLRYKFFSRSSLEHPAKLHLGLVRWIVEKYTRPGDVICDPMAGIGSTAYAALLQRDVILREIEPKWLAISHENAALLIQSGGMFSGNINISQHDAREPWGITCDLIITSPPYSCRAASNEKTRVGTLPHRLRAMEEGKMKDRWVKFLENPTQGSAGAIRFFYGSHPCQIGHLRNAEYWDAMQQIYGNAYRALRAGGLMILVIKDHIRNGKRVTVSDDTIALCNRLGFSLEDRHVRVLSTLSLWQRRRKEQGQPVIEEEDVIVLKRT